MAIDLIIWGAGGQARVVADIARANDIEVRAFVDDSLDGKSNAHFQEKPLLANREAVLASMTASTQLVIAIGNCAARMNLGRWARDHGCPMATLVHPRATVAQGVEIGG